MVEGLYSRRRHLGKQGEFEEFKREYGKKAKEVKQQKKKDDKKVFSRELPGSFTAKVLWGWSNREYKRQRERR